MSGPRYKCLRQGQEFERSRQIPTLSDSARLDCLHAGFGIESDDGLTGGFFSHVSPTLR